MMSGIWLPAVMAEDAKCGQSVIAEMDEKGNLFVRTISLDELLTKMKDKK